MNMVSKNRLDGLLAQTAARHHHLCPRQVLGVRMGLYAGEELGIEVPQVDKRLFVFMETDGCACDGVAVATGAHVGRRTMRMMDFGKVAATFVDTATGDAIRIRPTSDSRERAVAAAPEAPDRWHAQLVGYQRLPAESFLEASRVALTLDLGAIISRDGIRVFCDACGEEISNGREVVGGGSTRCRSCAGDAYYLSHDIRILPDALSLFEHEAAPGV
jgi:formylmethanofuran dehydrogenase subunit E